MDEYISRKAAIAYIREQSEECQKAFEELGGESGIYADAYNDLAEDFYSIPAADAQGMAVKPKQYGVLRHVRGFANQKLKRIHRNRARRLLSETEGKDTQNDFRHRSALLAGNIPRHGRHAENHPHPQDTQRPRNHLFHQDAPSKIMIF